ncbi:uncharacterized protein IL334_007344 [Kwoniella shivajii]|uniref:Uncharacterized protein n=1 Tax=Kwoniella shivajii TaxID=564305 RepID=A0ABZ1D8E8_9TREE|nr:hypothetical protein IL334_007344 [Kwoniella shivajii]
MVPSPLDSWGAEEAGDQTRFAKFASGQFDTKQIAFRGMYGKSTDNGVQTTIFLPNNGGVAHIDVEADNSREDVNTSRKYCVAGSLDVGRNTFYDLMNAIPTVTDGRSTFEKAIDVSEADLGDRSGWCTTSIGTHRMFEWEPNHIVVQGSEQNHSGFRSVKSMDHGGIPFRLADTNWRADVTTWEGAAEILTPVSKS